MSEQNIQTIIAAITEMRTEMRQDFSRVDGQLRVIDKRLSLIEQRLGNMEQWVPVDNKHLLFDNGQPA